MFLSFVAVPFTCSVTNTSTGKCARTPKPRTRPYGYWTKHENLAQELVTFAISQNDPTRMPTQAELLAAGRSDIVSAIRRNGKWSFAAKLSGLIPTSIAKPRSVYLSFCTPISGARPHNYWSDFANLRAELAPYISSGKLPNANELYQQSRSDLVRAIGLHGGFPVVSARLQLRSRYRPSKYWLNFDNVAKELLDFIEVHGVKGVMPPITLLRESAPQGLLSAIQYQHGGTTIVGKRMGLKCENPRRQHGYWCSQENRILETRAFMQVLLTHDPTRDVNRMPTYSEMMRHGRQDLAAGLLRYEGFIGMAELLGLCANRRKVTKSQRTRSVDNKSEDS